MPPTPDQTVRQDVAFRTLRREVLRSQSRRAWAMVCVIGALLIAVLVLRLVPTIIRPDVREQVIRAAFPIAGLLVLCLVYEAAALAWLRSRLSRGGTVPPWFEYVNAAVEVSLPTGAMLAVSSFGSGANALTGAAPFAYPLLVFMTALSLNARLCVFGGLLAAAQYLVVALWLIRHLPDAAGAPANAMALSTHQHLLKGFMIATTGGAAAFVAAQIRGQVARVLHAVGERDRAVSIFGQHVSPQVVDLLLSQPSDFAGQERNVCVMFLDIRDFSRIAADRSPSEVMDYLNTLFGFMIPVINAHHGMVNKFLGDGFMAVFGAPVKEGEPCRNAAAASREVLARLADLNREGRIPATRVGIGLHLGVAVTGNVGSSDRLEYTVIGDVVNVASRIEQATKQFDAQLLASGAVAEALAGAPGPPPISLGPVQLKGQPHPIELFRLA
ncbi:MAG: adenylate/guanylate cyclase domain-containing protein [Phycisphaerales bacterium]